MIVVGDARNVMVRRAASDSTHSKAIGARNETYETFAFAKRSRRSPSSTERSW